MRRVGIAGVVATLAGAAACSGGAASRQSAQACGAPGVTASGIKFGVIYPDTGQLASAFSTFRGGVDARIGVENERGGVNGRTLTYSWQDDGSEDSRNLVAAKQLVERDDVLAVIEMTTGTKGSAQYLHDRGVPTFGPAIEYSWSKFDNMFSWSVDVSPTSTASTVGDFVRDHGGRRAALIVLPGDTVGTVLSEQIARSLEAEGVPVVTRITLSGNGVEAKSALDQIVASRADTITGTLIATQLVPLVAAARAARVSLPLVVAPWGIYDRSIVRQYGSELNGVYTFVNRLPFEVNSPAQQTFEKAVVRYAPQIQPPQEGLALDGWLLADMFIKGLQVAGPCPNRADLIRNLRHVRGYTAGGLLPAPVDFSETTKIARCYAFLRITPQAYAIENPVNRCGSVLPSS